MQRPISEDGDNEWMHSLQTINLETSDQDSDIESGELSDTDPPDEKSKLWVS